MFVKQLIYLGFALALSPAWSKTIPLRKRESLTRPDGVFDYDRAILATVNTANKHRQNLLNFKVNQGALYEVCTGCVPAPCHDLH